MNQRELWERFQRYLCDCPSLGLRLDISRMMFDEAYLEGMAERIDCALSAMDELERGKRVNIDEDRMVGHYWLRAPDLAPDKSIQGEIERAIVAVREFADAVHAGTIKPQRGDGFYIVLLIGIGGSALGPQFVADALGTSDDPMIIRFIDNTDPDGIDRTLAELDETLEQTLTVVISKSGTTKEPRNAMLEVADAYQRQGLAFAKHAVAVTCEGTELDRKAVQEDWLRVFPIWEWVGGRTSVTSSVGLLPAALLGLDIDAFLSGARDCDAVTRERDVLQNPAALLALMWHHACEKCAKHNMVVMPYRDRLSLLGRYLQQLVMESIGKELDRGGKPVAQGLTVFGRKGSSDQHSYVQQLRDGRNDFFVTFITCGKDGDRNRLTIEEGVTSGDYLHASWQGTRSALTDKGRESITITLDAITAHRVGALVALFERAVGLYAELIDVNAYDQPGVEAGKRVAASMLDLQRDVTDHLSKHHGAGQTAEQVAGALGRPEVVEAVYLMLEHASANPDHGVRREAGTGPSDARFHVPGVPKANGKE